MLSPELKKRNEPLFASLVPLGGHAATLEGECLRAINKIVYRYYNDGDYWFEGYGTETAGPAAAFLCHSCPLDLREDFNNSYGTKEEEYARCLSVITEKIVSYVEERVKAGTLTPNHEDMLDFEPKYHVKYDNEDEDEF